MSNHRKLPKEKSSWNFPGGPVTKESTLPMQGAWVRPLLRELDPTRSD